MKKGFLLFLMILAVPAAFADIAITTDQSIYNVGNKIKTSASILYESNFEGLFKLAISCDSYKLEYFIAPVSLEANFRTAINVPELAATSSMLGNCTITGDLATNDNLVVEKKKSNNFAVTRQLTVLPVNSRLIASPSDIIFVSGVINEAHGNNILKATAKITLGNDSYNTDAVNGKFNLSVEIPKNIKSGRHEIGISTFDSKNNFGDAAIEFDVTAIPTYMGLELGNSQLSPGSKIGIVSSLYDQADELINTSLDLKLDSPSKNNVFTKAVQSNEKMEYEFSQYAEPGAYTLTSAYRNLLVQSSINITTVREVKIRYENEIVSIENIGNVPFEDELTFILKSDSKKYPITKEISVEPSKLVNIDLSKEVPLGIYDIKMSVQEGIEPVKDKVEEVIQGIADSAKDNIGNLMPGSDEANENLLADNVEIRDNRPIYKKVATGLGSISGALVGSDGVLAKNPLIAPITLVAIVLLLVFRYGRKPIMALIKGKKDDKKEDED